MKDVVDQKKHLISPMKDIREMKNRLRPPSAQMISSKMGGRRGKSDKFGKGWDGGLDVERKCYTARKAFIGLIVIMETWQGKLNTDNGRDVPFQQLQRVYAT